MAMNWGAWKSALIDQDVDDDLTAAINLGWDYEFLMVLIPTITSSTITVHISRDNVTFFPLYELDDDATGDFASATSGATTTHAVIFRIGGCRWVKISAGSAQAADETFYIRGFNR